MAIRGRPGERRTYIMRDLRDPDGALVSAPLPEGHEIRVTVSSQPGLPVTEVVPTGHPDQPGRWDLTLYLPDERGLYTLIAELVRPGDDLPPLLWRDAVVVWDVAPTGWSTRRELRQAIAERLGDFVELTATADGTTISFTDQIGLSVPMGAYKARQAVVIRGHTDNVGELRRVVMNSPTNQSLTVTPALPQPFRRGDVIHLHDSESRGFRVEQINAAINRAIKMVGVQTFFPTSAVVTTAANDGSSIRAAIPANWEYLSGVEVPAGNRPWVAVPPARNSAYPGWWVERDDTGRWSVKITSGPGWWWPWLDEAQAALVPPPPTTVKLIGLAPPDPLQTDDDATPVDFAWLVERAMSELRLARAPRSADRSTEERAGYINEQNADRMRPGAGRLLPPNARRLR